MSNTIIFTIGRMNPPTPGHMGLIKNLIERAIQFRENKVGIILSHSVDSVKNPLECKEKREFILSGMIDALKNQMKREGQFPSDKIDEMQVVIVCMDDPTPEEFGKNRILKSFNALLSQFGYENPNAYLIVGGDRATDYGWIEKSLGDKISSYQVEPLDRPEGAMSATEMRGYVKRGEYHTFMEKMRETGIPDEKSDELYGKVSIGLTPLQVGLTPLQVGLTPLPVKKSASKSSLKSVKKIGGKTYKRRKQRKTKHKKSKRRSMRKY
jgi:hypothetical protein